MIDINELRRKVNSADIVDHIDLHANIKPFLSELLDRLETAEKAVTEAYQRGYETGYETGQEEVEKERDDVAQQLVQSEIGKRKISEERDALQVEVGKLKDLEVARCVKINGYIVDNARLVEEVERLRAKIAEMEKQEPVATIHINSITGNPSVDFIPGHCYLHHNSGLYALPGAQTQGEMK